MQRAVARRLQELPGVAHGVGQPDQHEDQLERAAHEVLGGAVGLGVDDVDAVSCDQLPASEEGEFDLDGAEEVLNLVVENKGDRDDIGVSVDVVPVLRVRGGGGSWAVSTLDCRSSRDCSLMHSRVARQRRSLAHALSEGTWSVTRGVISFRASVWPQGLACR